MTCQVVLTNKQISRSRLQVNSCRGDTETGERLSCYIIVL